MDLTLIWAGIIGFAIFAYVVMDGFDLGIGVLFPGLAVGEERDSAMNAIAPVWDGNETWLVMGGGGLFAAFPLAYAILLPACYPPIVAMLLGLIFRGVAFEFRWRDLRHRPLWDMAFALGSLVAAFSQGVVLGAVLQGVKVEGEAYAGGWLDWLSPFSLLTGASVTVGYALLGATWLVWRTQGSAQIRARVWAQRLAVATLAALALVSAATPFLAFDYWRRWFALPNLFVTAQVPLLTLIVAAVLIASLRRGAQAIPFLCALGLFGLGFLGLAISVYPYAVPRALTIWDAAAPPSSQLFMLVGASAILPLILGYTFWAYWVFRGKVSLEGYH